MQNLYREGRRSFLPTGRLCRRIPVRAGFLYTSMYPIFVYGPYDDVITFSPGKSCRLTVETSRYSAGVQNFSASPFTNEP